MHDLYRENEGNEEWITKKAVNGKTGGGEWRKWNIAKEINFFSKEKIPVFVIQLNQNTSFT